MSTPAPPPADLSFPALVPLGWDARIAAEYAARAHAASVPGRVTRPGRGAHVLIGPDGRASAAPAAHLDVPLESPTVGDWVVWSPAASPAPTIDAVLPRSSAFVRHAAGESTRAQVLAANVDVLLVAVALTASPNLRRLERFLTLGWESGAQPVVLLTKADVCDNVDAEVRYAGSAAPGVAVHPVSALTGAGMEALGAYVDGHSTLALVGSSGAGKSTLVNRLTGAEVMATTEIRDDGKGRHTTTHRELVPLPGGGVLIDTPGLRSLQLWDAADGLDRAFSDVEELATGCRFTDCGHHSEPGCAVTGAVAEGGITARRLESYRRLQRELAWLDSRHDARARAESRRRWRAVARAQRANQGRP